jgi:aryl-alcohol dehydrogenase-like predicted oxidoreductase
VPPSTCTLGDSGLEVFRFCLGGNVFGWTADESASFDVLDAYAEAGGNFIDTADVYSAWVPGNQGGESESIIGRWMAARGNRERMIIATKVGMAPDLKGLSALTIRRAAERSLKRLGTDYIDLYYAHADDTETPLRNSLGAFDALVKEGKVRFIGASNYSAARLAEALAVSASEDLAEYVALQPHYNLVHRDVYEGDLRDLCVRERISCVPYYALASGFLTGKYRDGSPVASARAQGAGKYLDARGRHVLGVLDRIAETHRTTVAAVALAWLLAQPMVAAPIASARTVQQLSALLPAVSLTLSTDELAQLSA